MKLDENSFSRNSFISLTPSDDSLITTADFLLPLSSLGTSTRVYRIGKNEATKRIQRPTYSVATSGHIQTGYNFKHSTRVSIRPVQPECEWDRQLAGPS